MGYTKKTWKRRLAERSDLSSKVVHLTREQTDATCVDTLVAMLTRQKINGSDPSQAFIHGDKSVVCFQDSPLSGICQNVFYEQKYRETNADARLRYRAAGLMFEKSYVFARGGRPVVYEVPSEAKRILNRDEWWRIVNFDLSDEDNIVDWTHEREWRLPDDFDFDRKDATVLVVNKEMYANFVRKAGAEIPGGIGGISGIVVMENILY